MHALRSVAPAGQEADTARFGPYVLLERLGKGGMAEVHRAKLERGDGFQKLLALKRILPELVDDEALHARFLDEARTVAALQHPNVVQVFDFGHVDGRLFLAMELVDGIDLWRLAQIARREGSRIDLPAALFIVAEAARGLGHAHGLRGDAGPQGIVHRDVSPQNILLGRQGEVKVADFGIAKVAGAVFQRRCETTQGAVMGKLRYMAPEQVSGGVVDGRTDIFALGVVLHELVTGAPLHDAQNPGVLLDMVRAASVKPPSQRNPIVPQVVDEVVMKALARNPADRFQRADQLARALTIAIAEIAPGYGRDSLADVVAGAADKLRKPVIEIVASVDVVEDPTDASGDLASSDHLVAGDEAERTPPQRGTRVRTSQRVPEAPLPVEPAALDAPMLLTNGMRPPDRAPVPFLHIVVGAVAVAAVSILAVVALRVRGADASRVAPPVTEVTRAAPAPLPVPMPAVVVPPEARAPVRAVAPRATKPARRILDGKIVLLDNEPAPPGQEAAVARARIAYDRAQASLLGHRTHEAEEGFERALSAYPGYAPAYRALGASYLSRGEIGLAADAWRTYLRAAPNAADAGEIRRQLAKL